MHDNITARAIQQAIMRRHLQELEQGGHGGGSPVIHNNVYGGPVGQGDGGMRGQMSGEGGEGGDDSDYFVDIIRRDLAEKDPETGKPVGWHKKVHRFKTKKKVT